MKIIRAAKETFLRHYFILYLVSLSSIQHNDCAEGAPTEAAASRSTSSIPNIQSSFSAVPTATTAETKGNGIESVPTSSLSLRDFSSRRPATTQVVPLSRSENSSTTAINASVEDITTNYSIKSLEKELALTETTEGNVEMTVMPEKQSSVKQRQTNRKISELNQHEENLKLLLENPRKQIFDYSSENIGDVTTPPSSSTPKAFDYLNGRGEPFENRENIAPPEFNALQGIIHYKRENNESESSGVTLKPDTSLSSLPSSTETVVIFGGIEGVRSTENGMATSYFEIKTTTATTIPNVAAAEGISKYENSKATGGTTSSTLNKESSVPAVERTESKKQETVTITSGYVNRHPVSFESVIYNPLNDDGGTESNATHDSQQDELVLANKKGSKDSTLDPISVVDSQNDNPKTSFSPFTSSTAIKDGSGLEVIASSFSSQTLPASFRSLLKEEKVSENPIKLIDEEKIDPLTTKVMKKYQQSKSFPNSRLEGNVHADMGEKIVDETSNTGISSTKKKFGETVMGHDGVKVTRKKQLVDKTYKENMNTMEVIESESTVPPSANINDEEKILNVESKIVADSKRPIKVLRAKSEEKNYVADDSKRISGDGEKPKGKAEIDAAGSVDNELSDEVKITEPLGLKDIKAEDNASAIKIKSQKKIYTGAKKNSAGFKKKDILVTSDMIGSAQKFETDTVKGIGQTTLSDTSGNRNINDLAGSDSDVDVSTTHSPDLERRTTISSKADDRIFHAKITSVEDYKILPESVDLSEFSITTQSTFGIPATTSADRLSTVKSTEASVDSEGENFQGAADFTVKSNSVLKVHVDQLTRHLARLHLNLSKVVSTPNADTSTDPTDSTAKSSEDPNIKIDIPEAKTTSSEPLSSGSEGDVKDSLASISVNFGGITNRQTVTESTTIVYDNIHKGSSMNVETPSMSFNLPSPKNQATTASMPKAKYQLENDTDILVVEITDISNASSDINLNENPKFTFHTDHISEYDSPSGKNFFDDINSKSDLNSEDDDLFVPDLKLAPLDDLTPNSANYNQEKTYPKNTIDRDSDTIFYISNTEVKVIESIPTTRSDSQNYEIESSFSSEQHHRKPESQYYPSIYEEDVIIDFPAKNKTSVGIEGQRSSQLSEMNHKGASYPDRYEEDIILSPLKNNFDPLKIIRNSPNGESEYGNIRGLPANIDENLSISYVGESFIEVQESTNTAIVTTAPASTIPSQESFDGDDSHEERINRLQQIPTISSDTSGSNNEPANIASDVIIQPVVISDTSIGVPVIGELPPQIELKEIDFIPGDAGGDGGVGETGSSSGSSNKNNNDSGEPIQYGGDLFAGGGDGISAAIGVAYDSGYGFGEEKLLTGGRRQHSSALKLSPEAGGTGDDVGGGESIDVDDDEDASVTSQIVMHAVDNLQKTQLIADEQSSGQSIEDSRELLPDSKRAGGNSTQPEPLGNATAFSVLEDADGENYFADIPTLIIACFATLVPLILSVLFGFGVRYLWRKYRRDGSGGGGLIGDNSTDPLAAKSITLSQDELKSTESGYSINRSNDTLDSSADVLSKLEEGEFVSMKNGVDARDNCCGGGGSGGIKNGVVETLTAIDGGTTTTHKSNHSGANGSVITMTLKNNHLIVETEERNDISRDARETKMHYHNSEKDGVFVVEVARGADSTATGPETPRKDAEHRNRGQNCILDIGQIDTMANCNKETLMKSSTNHEEVQIHQPPRGDSSATDDRQDVIVEVDETSVSLKSQQCENIGASNTGLSQSDLSSSSADSNKAYTYGNQQLYTLEAKSYDPPSPKIKLATSTSPSLATPPSDNSDDGNGERDGNADDSADGSNNPTKLDLCETTSAMTSKNKPIITAALLKQDTVIEVNGNRKLNDSNNLVAQKEDDDTGLPPPPLSDIIIPTFETNGHSRKDIENVTGIAVLDDEKIIVADVVSVREHEDKYYQEQQRQLGNGHHQIENLAPDNNGHTNGNGNTNEDFEYENTNDYENGFDSIISLPAPPTSDEIKQFNDVISMETTQLDSLPPPPPPLIDAQTNFIAGSAVGEGQNELMAPTIHEEDENEDEDDEETEDEPLSVSENHNNKNFSMVQQQQQTPSSSIAGRIDGGHPGVLDSSGTVQQNGVTAAVAIAGSS